MLKKLSLAALVAMGSMTFATATEDLSSAIQGVTIGGYLRYRGTEDNYKTDGNSDHQNSTTNEYKAVVKVGIKASDTMSVHGAMVYKDSFNSNDTNNEQVKPFNVTEAYLQYKNAGADVKAGMMNLATPLSDHDDDRGNGVLATYTMNGITGAFGYFNEISTATGAALHQNLGVLAVIADIKPAKVQAWYYNVSDSGSNTKDGYHAYFLEASASVSPVTVKAQYAAAKSNEDGAKTQKFGALAVVANVDMLNVTAAYLNFGKNGSDVTVGTKNADGLIAAGDILTDVIQQNSGLTDGWGGALVASAKVMDNTKVGIQYVHASVKPAAGKTKYNEYDLDASYAYNKKLNFSGYYAILKADIENNPNQTQNEFRVEAKYSF